MAKNIIPYSMVSYKCERCDKNFKHRNDYVRHLNRVNPCERIDSVGKPVIQIEQLTNSKLLCKFCSKSFSHKSSLSKHMKERCAAKREIRDMYDRKLHELVGDIEDIRTDNQELRNELRVIRTERAMKITNKIVNTANINNPTINIVNYGSEDIDALGTETIVRCLKRGYYSVYQLIQELHFNPDRPENHNLMITNMRSPYIHIYKDGKWEVALKEEIIDDLYGSKRDYVEGNYMRFKEYLTDFQIATIEKYLNTKDDHRKIRTVKSEIKVIMYNRKDLPLRTSGLTDPSRLIAFAGT